MTIAGHQWGALGVEVSENLMVVAGEAIADAGLAPSEVTARTLATGGPAGLRVDWQLFDIEPVSFRDGAEPGAPSRIISIDFLFLLTVGQDPAGPVDDVAITAFGAVVGRLSDRPVRITSSTVAGRAIAMRITREPTPWAEVRDAFAASHVPLSRGAVYRVGVSESAEPGVVSTRPGRVLIVAKDAALPDHLAGRAVASVDLGRVESAYVGEAEKALGDVLAASASSDAVLLFDEADALFGARADVRDAHDRYAGLDPAALPRGSTVVVRTDDADVISRLVKRGAESVQDDDPPV